MWLLGCRDKPVNDEELSKVNQPTAAVDPFALLSERERLVASKSAEGLTYREIADVLVIAPNTVRKHLSDYL